MPLGRTVSGLKRFAGGFADFLTGDRYDFDKRGTNESNGDDDKPKFQDVFKSEFGKGMRSYTDSFNKGSSNRMAGAFFPGVGDGATSMVAPNLAIRDEKGLYPTGIIQGMAGQPSFLGSLARTAAGAAVTAGIGALCDVRVKEDISPLQTTEVNDQLAEFAFFVKDLNECS